MSDPTKTLKEIGFTVITDEDIARDLAHAESITITRAKGGTSERQVKLIDVQIPDAWHVAMRTKESGDKHGSELILELWYLAHDLLRHIRENE